MNYHSYTVEDFLADPFFQQWLLTRDDESNAFWQSWIDQNPDKQLIIQEAISIATHIDFSKKWTATERVNIWTNIHQSIDHPPTTAVVPMRFTSRKVWLTAASVLFVLGITVILLRQNQMIQTGTSYGEIKKISLSDGSIITLNSNSRLRYSNQFLNEKEREIWIDGEAFFEVKKRIVNGRKIPFIVHANKLSIQVLGTEFNVTNRRGAVNVALQHGSVKVVDINNNKNAVLLNPGEVATQSVTKTEIQKQNTDLEQYISWKDKVIVFRKKSLQELSEMMMDLYNIKVMIDNPALEAETFTGSFPTDSSQVLFEKLEMMYPLTIIKTGNEYHIK